MSERMRGKARSRPGNRDRKRGVALVATLSLLAALLIMALSYAAFMRTERTAAANFSYTAQTRLLTMAALDTVLHHINEDPAWGAVDRAIPDWGPEGALYRPSGNAPDIVYGTWNTGGTKHYMPTAALMPDANKNLDSQWFEIINEDDELIGVYAMVVADDSTSIDVNHAGTNTYFEGARNSATNLYLQVLNPNWNRIADARDLDYIKFYNPAEFRGAMTSEGLLSAAPGGGWPDDRGFTTYSKFVQRYRPDLAGQDKDRVRINRLLGELNADRAEVERAFADGGVADPAALYRSLQDYVDEDYELSGGALDYGTEAVPMINEIVVSNMYTVTQNPPTGDPPVSTYNVTNSYRVGVELWFPFVGEDIDREYNLQFRATYDAGGIPPEYPTPGTADILEANLTFVSPIDPANPDYADQYETLWSEEIRESAENLPSPPPPGLYSRARVRIDGGVVRQGYAPGAAVDQLPPGIVLEIGRLARLQEGQEAWVTAEVEDPRINHRVSDWQIAGSSGVPNHTLHDEVDNPDGINTATLGGIDDDGEIYIANRPVLNVGELGFLGLGDPNLPWTSVDLINEHRGLLDTFTTHQFTPRDPDVFGLVNLNATDRYVLLTALIGAVIERFPDDPSANTPPLNVRGAGSNLADAIQSYTQSQGGLFYKSEMVEIEEFWDGSVGPQVTENQKESLIRQCADMFDTRGNTYAVALAVRSIRDRSRSGSSNPNEPDGRYDPVSDRTLGEQYAVAQIWRDPLSKRAEITFFKWVARTN